MRSVIALSTTVVVLVLVLVLAAVVGPALESDIVGDETGSFWMFAIFAAGGASLYAAVVYWWTDYLFARLGRGYSLLAHLGAIALITTVFAFVQLNVRANDFRPFDF